jgi:ABC-2 type transport system permease protein
MNRPLIQLLLYRFRIFFREPSAVFWTYGFPILLTVALGIAFKTKPPGLIKVDIVNGEAAETVAEALERIHEGETFKVRVHTAEECRERLRLGKCDVVVSQDAGAESYIYRYDPTRPESLHARARVDDALQRAAGRSDPLSVADQQVTEPGSRYIDFLLPGLLGMNLMGSGLWGVGFVVVDQRVRKLLKRFLATPMRRSHFLWSMIGARMAFTLPEMAIVLLAGVLMFHVPVRGNLVSILIIVMAGGMCFAGIGLLVASRAQRIETVSGLMNLVMLPMWLLSGIFFSTENFPDAIQPFIQALPLTQLNNALRAVILEGASLTSQWLPLVMLLAFALVSFYFALRLFRWT